MNSASVCISLRGAASQAAHCRGRPSGGCPALNPVDLSAPGRECCTHAHPHRSRPTRRHHRLARRALPLAAPARLLAGAPCHRRRLCPAGDPPGALRHRRARPDGRRVRRRQRHHPAQARRVRAVRQRGPQRATRRRGQHAGVPRRQNRRQQHRRLGLPGQSPRPRRRSGRRPGAGPRRRRRGAGGRRGAAGHLGIAVTIANRTPEHAEALAHDLPGLRVHPLGAAAATRSPTMRCWSTRPRSACRATRRCNST